MTVDAWIEKWHDHGTFREDGLAAKELRQVVKQARFEAIEECMTFLKSESTNLHHGTGWACLIERKLQKREDS